MIKKFFIEHDHLALALRHVGTHNGEWVIRIFNTTYDFGVDPIFEHRILDSELDCLNVDFETAIMTPIINWWDIVSQKSK